MDMHAHFTLKDYQTYTVDVVVTLNGERYCAFRERFVYNERSANGIAKPQVQGTAAYADGALHYNFSAAAQRTLCVLSIDGRLMYRAALTAQRGAVSLQQLPLGAYIYNVHEQGRATLRGKFLVNK